MSKRIRLTCQFAGVTMFLTSLSRRHPLLIFVSYFLLPPIVMGQLPQGISGSLTVHVQGVDGAPIDQLAVVVLTSIGGQHRRQATARSGVAEFTGLEAGSYSLSVIATGYAAAVEEVQLNGSESSIATVMLWPASDGHAAVAVAGPPILAPEAKKKLAKALEAMRTGKLAEAHNQLVAVYRLAPGNPEVNYVFGLYSAQAKEWGVAKSYWEKALNLYPKHVGALISMGTALLRENKLAEAEMYFKKAVEAEPSSWRAHGLLADACLRQNSVNEAVSEAERAMELGHGQAAVVEPLLARALAKRGDDERAIRVLKSHLAEHPSDEGAKKQLENIQALSSGKDAGDSAGLSPDSTLPPAPLFAELSLLPPSNWLPLDVDERVPPLEPGTSCDLKEVLQSAENRVE
jgi:tetratricopeptide (TPR) repeat protein